MQEVVLVVHLFVALAIIIIVLIQPSESGGFLGSGGSMSNALAPRRQGDVLSRATNILAICFFVTSLILALLAKQHPASTSILDDATAVAAPTSAPIGSVDKDAPAIPPADSPLKNEEGQPTGSAIPAEEGTDDAAAPANDDAAASGAADDTAPADEAPKAPIAK